MGSVELFPMGKCESCQGEERKDEKIEKMPEEVHLVGFLYSPKSLGCLGIFSVNFLYPSFILRL